MLWQALLVSCTLALFLGLYRPAPPPPPPPASAAASSSPAAQASRHSLSSVFVRAALHTAAQKTQRCIGPARTPPLTLHTVHMQMDTLCLRPPPCLARQSHALASTRPSTVRAARH